MFQLTHDWILANQKPVCYYWGGGVKLWAPTVFGGGGGINKDIPKNLSIAQKNVEMNFETIASTWKWRYLLLFATYF